MQAKHSGKRNKIHGKYHLASWSLNMNLWRILEPFRFLPFTSSDNLGLGLQLGLWLGLWSVLIAG